MSGVPDLHKSSAPTSLGVFILTCSTSRHTESKAGKMADDVSGDIIEQFLRNAGHRIEGRALVPDSSDAIRKTVKNALRSASVDGIVITGGTGLSPRDVTIETLSPIFDKEINGFGELFRKISYDSIGSPAMLTRATAGLVNGKVVFCLPGSPDAVRIAMDRLILPELAHIIRVSREH